MNTTESIISINEYFPFGNVDYHNIDHILWLKNTAVDMSITGILFLNPKGKITYINEAAVHIWGWDSNKNFLGKYAAEFGQSWDQLVDIFGVVKRKGYWIGEIGTVRKDRSCNTVHLQASLIKNKKGNPICIMCSFVDVTEKKNLEKQMTIKDKAVEKSINGMVITDIHGKISYVNDAFYKISGAVSLEDVLGRPIFDFARSEKVAGKIKKSIFKYGRWFGELEVIRKGGKIIDVQCSMNIVDVPGMDTRYILFSFVDITDRKIVERELKKSHEELEMRVVERTRELECLNQENLREIDERKQIETLLLKKEKDLIEKSQELMEMNSALNVLLKQRDQDKENTIKDVFSNIENNILPYLKRLQESSSMNRRDKECVAIIEAQMNSIISPFLRNLINQYSRFTPAEIRISSLIKDGKSTKEISKFLNVSAQAVEFHRKNIRKKLGLVNQKMNLSSYLLSLT